MAQKKRAAKKEGSSRSTSAYGSRNTSAYGCLFWVVLLAVVVAVGFAAREPLKQVFVRSFGKKTETAAGQPAADQPGTTTSSTAAPAAPQKRQPAEPDLAPAKQPAQETTAKQPAAEKPPHARPALRRARVYFLAAGPDGGASLAPVDREIPQSDSPLRDALQSLLAGPDGKDRAKGLASGIPPDTRLRSVTVKDGVAYVDLSESFRFTASGVEGLTAELRQVVATATEFPTVDTVQILIEGKKVQYLGTEGVRIDEPLGRGSLPQ